MVYLSHSISTGCPCIMSPDTAAVLGCSGSTRLLLYDKAASAWSSERNTLYMHILSSPLNRGRSVVCIHILGVSLHWLICVALLVALTCNRRQYIIRVWWADTERNLYHVDPASSGSAFK